MEVSSGFRRFLGRASGECKGAPRAAPQGPRFCIWALLMAVGLAAAACAPAATPTPTPTKPPPAATTTTAPKPAAAQPTPTAAPKPAATQAPTTVKVGVPNDGVFGLIGSYILEKGIDRKYGIIMEPVWAPVAEVQRLLGLGELKVGLSTKDGAMNLNIQKVPLRLVLPALAAHQFLVVAKDSPYQKAEDLKGKKIATTGETTGMYMMFDYIMRVKGLDAEKDFQLIKQGSPAPIIALLDRGEIQGALLWEGHVSRLLATGKYRVLMGFTEELGKLFPGYVELMAYLSAHEDWLKANPEAAVRLKEAWLEGARGAREDQEFFRSKAKQFFGLEAPAEVDLAWERTRQFIGPVAKWPDPALIKAQKDRMRDAVRLGSFPSEAGPFVDVIFWE